MYHFQADVRGSAASMLQPVAAKPGHPRPFPLAVGYSVCAVGFLRLMRHSC